MIRIDISTDSAAFYYDQDVHHPGPELARILHDLANEIADGYPTGKVILRDSNGNRVGSAEFGVSR